MSDGGGSKRIVVIGSVNIDFSLTIDKLPSKGETVFGRDFRLSFGGKGANQAVAAARLGGDVSLVAKAGDDVLGKEAVENLRRANVDVAHVRLSKGSPTGAAAIYIESSGDNRIVVVKGANDLLSVHDIESAVDIIKGAAWVVIQLEIPIETVKEAIDIAYEYSARLILNPAPAQMLEGETLSKVALFVPNEIEASHFFGKQVSSLQEAEECALFLVRLGVENAVITLGHRGLMFANRSGASYIPGVKVEAVDATGAGDAFVGSLAHFLTQGFAIEQALYLANHYAALSVKKFGAQSSFLTADEFDTYLRSLKCDPLNR